MRIKKLAAAVALVTAVSALSGCKSNSPAAFPQDSASPNVNGDSVGTMNRVATALDDQTVKSKITGVDINAKELIGTVCNWIADNRYAGGEDKKPCELTVRIDNGVATVSDSTDENDWDARENCPESLKERIESDFPGQSFTAKVFIDDSGYAVFSWLVRDDADYSGAAPAKADFEAGVYDGWKSESREGMTEDGVIIGTYPKLHGKKS